MPDWDADSAQLLANLAAVLEGISGWPPGRERPTVELARYWHRDLMSGLTPPDRRYVGAFRGEPGLENVQVRIGRWYGVPAVEVAEALARFEGKLQSLVAALDAMIPTDYDPDDDQVAAIVDVCAWAHAEWVRIHPFGNGNGRVARLWANGIAMRYGLPPFVRLRPRPDGGYGAAGAAAMQADWKPTAIVFRKLLDDVLDGFPWNVG